MPLLVLPSVHNMLLTGLKGLAGGFHVHEYPVSTTTTTRTAGGGNRCSGAAGHYNPWGWVPTESPPPGRGTGEMYELGDLSGKFGLLTGNTRMLIS